MAHRLARDLSGLQTRVVTPDLAGADAFDPTVAVDVARSRPRRERSRASLAALNAAAVLEGLRFRPQVMLNLHIVTSPATAVLGAFLRAPSVQYFHAKEIPDKPRLSAFAVSRADVVIAVSAYTSNLIGALGAVPAQLRLIPPGVDLPAQKAAVVSDRPTVLTIARLRDRYKGHDVLARAIAQVRSTVPDVLWVVIGEGPLRGELERLTAELGIADAVNFLGAAGDRERDEWLCRCSLLALPSRLPEGAQAGEGFGMVHLEAAAYGKPVVAGNVAGVLDAVADGETGLLVDPTDAAAVAGAIASLLCDSKLAARLGAAGARRAQSFAWPLIAARLESLLLELVYSRARAPDHDDSKAAPGEPSA